MLRIVDGESKLAFEAGIAHSVTTGQLSGFGGWEVIGHADYTFDPGKGVSGVERQVYAHNLLKLGLLYYCWR